MIGIFINLWNRLTGGGTPAPTPALLDTYGGAAAAFSLRKLSSTYGGSAVRVRRSLDNTEQDIGFSGDNLDETALQAFVGYENLFARSEQFEDTAWLKVQSTITPNAGADPIGGNNAERWVNTGTSHYMSQNITLTVGQSYTISFWVKSNTVSSQTFRLYACSTITSPDMTATTSWQRFSFTFVASSPIDHGIARSTTNAPVDLLIFGAQLNQGVTAQPYQQTIAANTANGFVTKWYTQDGNGENLFTFSEQFENAAWTIFNSSIVPNSTTAPNGTLTADTILDNATSNFHSVYRAPTIINGAVYNYSFYAKAGTKNWVTIYYSYGSTTFRSYFNLSTGQFGTTDPAMTVSSVSVGGGWYRISASFIAPSAALTFAIEMANGNNTGSYLGDGTGSVFIWGAQLSQSSWLQGYQATTTTAVSRRDASQATAASQPRIVNAGVIERENGKPTMFYDGTNDVLALDAVSSIFSGEDTPLSVFGSLSVFPSGAFGISFGLGSSSSSQSFHVSRASSINQRQGVGAAIANVADTYVRTGIYRGLYVNAHMFSGVNLSLSSNNIDYVVNASMNTPALSVDRASIGAIRYITAPAGESFINGDISEIIIYPSSKYTDRSPIQYNLGSYFQTHWIGTQQALLDQFGGSAAAFSLRNLSSSYRGPLVRVRRSSDNAETDIGGTFSGDLDVNSLLAFTGGQNLLAYSEDFTNAAWFKLRGTATANATIAPDGTLTADSIVCNTNSANGLGVVYTRTSPSAVTTELTSSFYFKSGNRGFAAIAIYDNISDQAQQYYNLTTGQIASDSFTGGRIFKVASSIQNVGNGWYRCSLTVRYAPSVNIQIFAFPAIPSDGGLICAVGDFGYIWGAQLNTGFLQPYIPTTTAAINGANAFVTKWYDQSGIGDNLVLQSETFENASWVKADSTISLNTTNSPEGALTADSLNELASNASHLIYQSVTIPTTGQITASVYLKAKERLYANLGFATGGSSGPIRYGVIVDLQNGTIVKTGTISTPTGISSSILNAGNGWYRVSLTINVTTSGAGNNYMIISPSDSANPSYAAGTVDPTYVGVVGSGVYVWGAQVSAGSELLRYQPTTTAIAPKRDAVQTTAASQPRIVNAGSVESENGKPAIYSSSSAMTFPTISFANFTILWVSRKETELVNGSIILNDTSGTVSYMGDGVDLLGNPSAYLNNFSVITRSNSNNSIDGLETTYHIAYLNRRGTQAVGQFNNSENSYNNTVSSNPFAINSIGNYSAPSYNYVGDLQEILMYSDDRSANRLPISSNINTYYQIYWQGNGTALLDSFSGASAAYSLRNLSSAYTGPLIRVRRSSDNLERDIYGTFRGDLDLAALTSFVGANSGFVTTWYDQSGTGRHATQATAASQPRIVNAGAVDTQNGKPAIVFDGVNDSLVGSSQLPLINRSVFIVMREVSRIEDSGIFSFIPPAGSSDFNSTSAYEIQGRNTPANRQYGVFGSTSTTYYLEKLGSATIIPHVLISEIKGGSTANLYENSNLVASDNSFVEFDSLSFSGFALSARYLNVIGQTLYGNNIFQEFIYMGVDQSASRVNIQSNINNYYKIY